MLVMMLWGRMAWLRRDANKYTFRLSDMGKALQTNTEVMRNNLDKLTTWEIVEDYKITKGIAVVSIEVPVGMAIHTDSVYPGEYEPEVLGSIRGDYE